MPSWGNLAERIGNRPAGLVTLTVAVSLLLSVVLSVMHPVLNGDSILYLRTAERIGEDGLAAAFAMYDWPFLSWCLSILLELGLPPAVAGHALAAAFYALLCASFLWVVRLLGAGATTLAIAALTILTHPFLNEYRAYITRDAPYWALLLTSLAFLIRYSQGHRLRDIAGWGVAMALAVLFRIEALVVAAIVPLSLLLTGGRRRLRVAVIGASYAIGAAALAVVLMAGGPDEVSGYGTRLHLEIDRLPATLGTISDGFERLVTGLNAATAETPYGNAVIKDTERIVALGLAGTLVFNLLETLFPPFALLWLGNLGRRGVAFPSATGGTVVKTYLTAVLLYLAAFAALRHFSGTRYLLPAALLMLLWIPFIVRALFAAKLERRWLDRLKNAALVLVFVYAAVDSLTSSGAGKRGVLDATAYLAANVPAEAHLASNIEHALYFSGHDNASRLTEPRTTEDLERLAGSGALDYLVVHINHKEHALRRLIDEQDVFREVKRFANADGDAVVILAAP